MTSLRVLYAKNRKNLDVLSEEMLVALLQNGFEEVRPLLFEMATTNNYEVCDEILVLMSQSGDQTAKTILDNKYIEPVRDIVNQLHRRGRYNRGDDFEDLIQSGYLGYYKAVRDFKIEKKRPFRIFLPYVVKRHIESIISRSGNNKLRALNEAFSYHSPVNNNDTESTFEQMLSSEEYQPEKELFIVETFWELWEMFSETEKSVLWYYAEDYSYEEIGKIVFCDSHPTIEAQIKAVDNTIQRIKTKREDFLNSSK